MHDPEDVPRTTLKEGLAEEEPERVNLRGAGPRRLRVYDPEDVPRTTLKEGLAEEEPERVNLRGAGPGRLRVHDPEDVPRTTLKQGLAEEEPERVNLRGAGPGRLRVYDPEDVPRTTLKETALQEDAHCGNVQRSQRQGPVAPDEDDPSRRVPLRVLALEPDGGSLAVSVPRATVHDPEDVARTTIKEAAIDAPRETGNPDGLQGKRGGYVTAEYEAKETQKTSLADMDYYGTARTAGAGEGQGGYDVAPKDIRPSAKADIADVEYYGTAAEQVARRSMSTEDYANARVNEVREVILEGRDPTQQSVKVFTGQADMGLRTADRQVLEELDMTAERAQPRATYTVLDIGDTLAGPPAATADRQLYALRDSSDDNDNRLQQDVDANTVQLHDNPYHVRIATDDNDVGEVKRTICDDLAKVCTF